MKRNHKQGIAVFVAMCLVSALIGWASGYNFDYRSDGVAVWVGITLVFAGLEAFFCLMWGAE